LALHLAVVAVAVLLRWVALGQVLLAAALAALDLIHLMELITQVAAAVPLVTALLVLEVMAAAVQAEL
jgi:hypothetical protein